MPRIHAAIATPNQVDARRGLDAMAANVRVLVETPGLGTLHIVGHSMGGGMISSVWQQCSSPQKDGQCWQGQQGRVILQSPIASYSGVK